MMKLIRNYRLWMDSRSILGKEILTNSDECVSVIEDIIWSQKTNLDGSEMIDKEELL